MCMYTIHVPGILQVLLVASSFMSPADSKAWNNTNRVRMFGKPIIIQVNNLEMEYRDCIKRYGLHYHTVR